jgi:ATP-binding cassette subfamily F protein uup
MEAEAVAEELRRQTEDPAVLADRHRLTAVCAELAQAEERVKQLYARWEELEAKAGEA